MEGIMDQIVSVFSRPDLTDLLLVILAFLGWRVSNKVKWFTGALESHSTIMLWLEAQRGIGGRPIKLEWFDPDATSRSIRDYAPGTEVDFTPIYLAVPMKERQGEGNIIKFLYRRIAGLI